MASKQIIWDGEKFFVEVESLLPTDAFFYKKNEAGNFVIFVNNEHPLP